MATRRRQKTGLDYNAFQAKMSEITQQGFIPCNRRGDRAVGNFLEDLLGIDENNIDGPDFDVYELKSQRRESTSQMTLFTKAPLPRGISSRIRETFGYVDAPSSNGFIQLTLEPEPREALISGSRKKLHVPLYPNKRNTVGLWLEFEGDRIHIANEKGVEAYFTRSQLKEAFNKKFHKEYGKLIYVLADTKAIGKTEAFWYNEAYLLSGFGFERFSELLKEGLVAVELRMGHYPDGSPHDHGTAFRVLPRCFHRCFESIERILSPSI